jgi:hypothetical protein
MTQTDLLVWGVLAHVVADWLFQNEWMAINKVNWKHPAAWTHSGVHVVALCFVFHPLVALGLGISHLIIDTRKPKDWWQGVIKQTRGGEIGTHVSFWVDQVMHVVCIAIAALLVVYLL